MDDIKHNDMAHHDNTNGNDLSQSMSREDYLRRVQTAESVWLPRDVFEKLYLNPEKNVPGDLRKRVCITLTLNTACSSDFLTSSVTQHLPLSSAS